MNSHGGFWADVSDGTFNYQSSKHHQMEDRLEELLSIPLGQVQRRVQSLRQGALTTKLVFSSCSFFLFAFRSVRDV